MKTPVTPKGDPPERVPWARDRLAPAGRARPLEGSRPRRPEGMRGEASRTPAWCTVGLVSDPSTAGRDIALLFVTRAVRLFAYGFLSVVLVLYLAAAGLSEARIGLLLTLTLLGATVISLALTTRADRVGRRGMLIVGAALMVFAGALFGATTSFALLLLAATVGVISPAGNEVGPFLAIEQAALSQAVPGERRTHVFAWYQLCGADRKSTRLNSSHGSISYAVFCT